MKPTYNMRTFYTLILSQAFSMIGSRISGLAISMWVFGQTGDATPLTLVAFFQILPTVLASTLSGLLADRWNRRYVMALADAGQAVGTVLLLISFLSGNFQLWHLYAVSLFQSLFGVFQGPAFQASVTLLVPDDQRDRANAIQQISGPAVSAAQLWSMQVEAVLRGDICSAVPAAPVGWPIMTAHDSRPSVDGLSSFRARADNPAGRRPGRASAMPRRCRLLW